MNKHKINNHNNTFYNQKEQQSAKKMKHHRRDGTQPNLHPACARRQVDDRDIAGGCVLLWIDQNCPMEKKLFVSTL